MFIFKQSSTTYTVSSVSCIFGGLRNGTVTNGISIYDGTTLHRASSQLFQAAYDTAAGVLSGAHYIFGGNTTGTNSIGTITKYDGVATSLAANMPFTIRGTTVSPVSGNLYTFGGDTGTSSTVSSGAVTKFDGSASTTVGMTVLGSFIAYSCSGNVTTSEAYTFGGNTSGASGVVQKYSGGFATSTMASVYVTSNPIFGSAAASSGSTIYLFGGTNIAGNLSSGISSYNGTTLSTVSSFGNVQKNMSVASQSSYISMFGGTISGAYSSAIRRFTVSTTTVSTDSATLTAGSASAPSAGNAFTSAASMSSISITK